MKIMFNQFHKFWVKLTALLLLTAVSVVWCAPPAAAVSIKEEEDLAREFLRVISDHYELVDDPLILDYVEGIGRKIQPFAYHFYVIRDEVYNAFALPAGHIFVNTGLLEIMTSEDELAGILSHEIAHVVCRHISQRIERSKTISAATLAGVLAGVLLGAGTGNPEAMQALTIGSAAAGQTASLAYSREDESQADELGLSYLYKTGYSGEGMLSILKKIRSKRWFEAPDYMMTHPAVEERIAKLDTEMAIHEKETGKPRKEPPQGSLLFRRVKTRLKALYADPDVAMNEFRNALAKEPHNPDLAYGYGLVCARAGKRKEAIDLMRQALQKEALDPIILSDLGRIYFLDGQYEEAQRTLEGAVSLPGVNAEGYFYLGRTRMELGQLEGAASAFEKLLENQPRYVATYQFLGETYGRMERMPKAHYYLGLFQFKKGDFRVARYHLLRARDSIQDPAKLEIIKKVLETIAKLSKDQPRLQLSGFGIRSGKSYKAAPHGPAF
ncbi:MAG: M48 family metalloprotease [Desulfosarcinaceae bacterium]